MVSAKAAYRQRFSLNKHGFHDTRCRFVLEDNQGRRVLELNDIRNGIAEFSVNRLPGGMYFGRLIFDNTVIATEKITVVR